jgi:5-methylcytosine-specific restriction endonuclease McrA
MAKKRDYKKEYKRDHAGADDKKNRACRNRSRKKAGLKKGDGKEVDHKRPLKKGGKCTTKNSRVVSRSANRKKGSKT